MRWNDLIFPQKNVQYNKKVFLSTQEKATREKKCHMRWSFQIVQQILATFSFALIREGILFFLECSNGNAILKSEFVIALLCVFQWNKNYYDPLIKESVLKAANLGRNSKLKALIKERSIVICSLVAHLSERSISSAWLAILYPVHCL